MLLLLSDLFNRREALNLNYRLLRFTKQAMREPKILLHRFKVIFQVACFLFAIYFTTLFSTQYLENIDNQLIAIKKFNEDEDNRYPTFSFCFHGTRFHWFHDLQIFESYGINATQYSQMLKGQMAERYVRNDSFRSYNKIPVSSNSGYDINFNSFHLKPEDFIRSLHFDTEDFSANTIISKDHDWNATNKPPMHLSFQSADMICFSRVSNDALNLIRLDDLITIDSSVLHYYKETYMEIFVHYPNHLISSFGKAKYSTRFSHLISILNNGATPKILEFKLTELKRIKKRDDSKQPCSHQIQNYDQYLKQKISEQLIEEIGCVPIYLKTQLSKHTEQRVCTSAEDLREAYKTIDDLERILEDNEFACDEMVVTAIDSVNNYPNPIPEDIAIRFHYTEKFHYTEIQYSRAIGFEGWLSNVGGFVGIFLGYSMMQFPEFLLLFATHFNSKRRTTWMGKSLFQNLKLSNII